MAIFSREMVGNLQLMLILRLSNPDIKHKKVFDFGKEVFLTFNRTKSKGTNCRIMREIFEGPRLIFTVRKILFSHSQAYK